MTAPRRTFRPLGAFKLIAIVAACALLVACDDGPTGPPTVTTIAGNWHGSLHPGLGRFLDPCLQPASASATIRQDGSHVSGTLATESSGFRGGTLEGEFRRGSLIGTLRTGTGSIAVSGGATSGHLTITFFSPGQCGPNSIELER